MLTLTDKSTVIEALEFAETLTVDGEARIYDWLRKRKHTRDFGKSEGERAIARQELKTFKEGIRKSFKKELTASHGALFGDLDDDEFGEFLDYYKRYRERDGEGGDDIPALN
jgi:hypothetical protein